MALEHSDLRGRVGNSFVRFCRVASAGGFDGISVFEGMLQTDMPRARVGKVYSAGIPNDHTFLTDSRNESKEYWKVEMGAAAFLVPALRDGGEFGRLDGFSSPFHPTAACVTGFEPALLRPVGSEWRLSEPGHIV